MNDWLNLILTTGTGYLNQNERTNITANSSNINLNGNGYNSDDRTSSDFLNDAINGYLDAADEVGKEGSESSESNESLSDLRARKKELDDEIKSIRAERPRKRDYRDDPDGYRDAMKDYEERKAEVLKERHKVAQKIRTINPKKTSSQNSLAQPESNLSTSQVSTPNSSQPSLTSVSASESPANVNSAGETLQTPQLEKLGTGEYVPDGKTRAEDAIDDKYLSRNAQTLSKDEQIEILKKVGIDINKLEPSEATDGTYSFRKDNQFVRVVKENNDIKLIYTNMNDTKASSEVYKLNMLTSNANSSASISTTPQSTSPQTTTPQTTTPVASKTKDPEIEQAKLKLELSKIKLEELKLENRYSETTKNNKKEKSGLETITKGVDETNKLVRTTDSFVNSIRSLIGKKRRSSW